MRKKRACDIIVAIDPDAIKNGVATLLPATKALNTVCLTFAETLEYLRHTKAQALVNQLSLTVVIEAGWLNKTHWHIGYRDSARMAAAKGNAVGRNHETGRKLAEMCQHWDIPHELIKPLALRTGGLHLWQGKDGKITADELTALTGYKGRTNQEARDAALIAWVYAGMPMKITKSTLNR